MQGVVIVILTSIKLVLAQAEQQFVSTSNIAPPATNLTAWQNLRLKVDWLLSLRSPHSCKESPSHQPVAALRLGGRIPVRRRVVESYSHDRSVPPRPPAHTNTAKVYTAHQLNSYFYMMSSTTCCMIQMLNVFVFFVWVRYTKESMRVLSDCDI